MLKKLFENFAVILGLVLPSPFTIAVLLTAVTFLAALFCTIPDNISLLYYSKDVAFYWEKGVWELLAFAMQMMLMLVLGHVIALSKPISRLINYVVSAFCHSTANAALFVSFFTLLVSFVNWGLGLIFGAIMARQVAEVCSSQSIKINYPLIGAAGYSGLMVWHGGLSGSAPLKVAEEGHFLADSIGVIPIDQTIFSSMNIMTSLILLFILPLVLMLIGKYSSDSQVLLGGSPKQLVKKADIKGSEKLDESFIFGVLIGLIILVVCICKMMKTGSLSVITPNYINLLLFGFGILLHGNVSSFLSAVSKAISGATGIMIQFPLYAGIMGMMKYSGLAGEISAFFVSIANETTFPVYTFISAGIVNIFVPSGGGQWGVQGPIIVDAALQLKCSIPKSIMALAYGDQLTNMLQPFWALPLLGITGLKAKELLPYTFLIMIIGAGVFIAGLLLF